jgi:hypothetical protein
MNDSYKQIDDKTLWMGDQHKPTTYTGQHKQRKPTGLPPGFPYFPKFGKIKYYPTSRVLEKLSISLLSLFWKSKY